MKFFNSKKPKHPQERNTYAITTGDYVGEMFIYIESDDDCHKFLSVPKNVNRKVPKEKFELSPSIR